MDWKATADRNKKERELDEVSQSVSQRKPTPLPLPHLHADRPIPHSIPIITTHTQKYGALKHVVLSPWFQWLMERMDDLLSIEIMGEPRMAPYAIVVLMYMLFKARQSITVIGLLAAFFLNLHPIAIVGVIAGVLSWTKLRRPRGYDPTKPPPRTAPYVNVRFESKLAGGLANIDG